MADGLTFDGPSEDLDVFECPHCKQTIDTSADVCRFCGAKIDHEAAQKAAHLLAIVDQACSDASVLRNTAVTAFLLVLGVLYALLRASRLVLLVGFQNRRPGFLRPGSHRVDTVSHLVSAVVDEITRISRVTTMIFGISALRCGARVQLLVFMVAFGALFCPVLIFKFAHR